MQDLISETKGPFGPQKFPLGHSDTEPPGCRGATARPSLIDFLTIIAPDEDSGGETRLLNHTVLSRMQRPSIFFSSQNSLLGGAGQRH